MERVTPLSGASLRDAGVRTPDLVVIDNGHAVVEPDAAPTETDIHLRRGVLSPC